MHPWNELFVIIILNDFVTLSKYRLILIERYRYQLITVLKVNRNDAIYTVARRQRNRISLRAHRLAESVFQQQILNLV